MTYTLPDDIRQVAKEGEFNEFDLNEFFLADDEGDDPKFEHEDEVQKWLDLIRGAYRGTTIDDLKLGKDRPPLPFSDARLLGVLQHSFWFLPSVTACHAMAKLLKAKQNTFYHDYNVVIAAESKAGIGAAALPPVLDAMDEPLTSKSITLSCGKLTTGVTQGETNGSKVGAIESGDDSPDSGTGSYRRDRRDSSGRNAAGLPLAQNDRVSDSIAFKSASASDHIANHAQHDSK